MPQPYSMGLGNFYFQYQFVDPSRNFPDNDIAAVLTATNAKEANSAFPNQTTSKFNSQMKQFFGPHLRSLELLSKEKNSILFYQELFHLAVRLEQEERFEAAAFLYAHMTGDEKVAGGFSYSKKNVPVSIRQQAEKRLAVLSGKSDDLAAVIEYNARHFFRGLTSGSEVGSLLAGVLVGEGVRLLATRGLLGLSASFLTRGWAGEGLAAIAGVMFEAPAFALSQKVFAGLSDNQSFAFSSFNHALLSGFIYIGAMRMTTAVGNLGMKYWMKEGGGLLEKITRAAIPKLTLFAGISLGQSLETKFDMRQPQPKNLFFIDSLASTVKAIGTGAVAWGFFGKSLGWLNQRMETERVRLWGGASNSVLSFGEKLKTWVNQFEFEGRTPAFAAMNDAVMTRRAHFKKGFEQNYAARIADNKSAESDGKMTFSFASDILWHFKEPAFAKKICEHDVVLILKSQNGFEEASFQRLFLRKINRINGVPLRRTVKVVLGNTELALVFQNFPDGFRYRKTEVIQSITESLPKVAAAQNSPLTGGVPLIASHLSGLTRMLKEAALRTPAADGSHIVIVQPLILGREINLTPSELTGMTIGLAKQHPGSFTDGTKFKLLIPDKETTLTGHIVEERFVWKINYDASWAEALGRRYQTEIEVPDLVGFYQYLAARSRIEESTGNANLSVHVSSYNPFSEADMISFVTRTLNYYGISGKRMNVTFISNSGRKGIPFVFENNAGFWQPMQTLRMHSVR